MEGASGERVREVKCFKGSKGENQSINGVIFQIGGQYRGQGIRGMKTYIFALYALKRVRTDNKGVRVTRLGIKK